MRSTIAHGKTRYQPNFRVHPDMDDEPNVGLYRPDRTFTPIGSSDTDYRTFTGPRGTNSLRRWNESGDYVISDFRERYRVVWEIEKNINYTNAL